MKIESVFDPAFQQYGQVLTGYDLNGLLTTLDAVTPLPDGVGYLPEQGELQALPVRQEISDRAYGGMDVQLGWCNGHNTKLNCLEYHRDSPLPRRGHGGSLWNHPSLRALSCGPRQGLQSGHRPAERHQSGKARHQGGKSRG